MTDREMLELAAKAAGFEGRWITKGEGDLWLFRNDFSDPWNPLTDDGDALRLAVKLRINAEHMTTMGGRPEGINCWPVGRGDAGANEQYGTDPYAATRRAIVSAAAEIGRNMT